MPGIYCVPNGIGAGISVFFCKFRIGVYSISTHYFPLSDPLPHSCHAPPDGPGRHRLQRLSLLHFRLHRAQVDCNALLYVLHLRDRFSQAGRVEFCVSKIIHFFAWGLKALLLLRAVGEGLEGTFQEKASDFNPRLKFPYS
jgi:hypothetical protein